MLGDEFGRRKWQARLTRDKAKHLRGILRVKELRQAFDDLLGITGLWLLFQTGPTRRYLNLKCHEVSPVLQQEEARN